MSGERFPTVARVRAGVDGVGLVLLPIVVLALGGMYDAIGDGLALFGVPGDRGAGARTAASGLVLLLAAAAYVTRHRPVVAATVAASAVLPPAFLFAVPDTAFDLLAMWILGPPALAAALAACVPPPWRRPAGRPASATMDAPRQEP